MLDIVPVGAIDPTATVEDRFDKFIEWAQPFGKAGIDNVHVDFRPEKEYNPSDPWFQFSNSYVRKDTNVTRHWFFKYAYIGQGRKVIKKTAANEIPQINIKEGLIESGRYLSFAKAYCNILTKVRHLKSASKNITRALIVLEHALCVENGGNNDPININKKTFQTCINYIEKTHFSASMKYEIGLDVELH